MNNTIVNSKKLGFVALILAMFLLLSFESYAYKFYLNDTNVYPVNAVAATKIKTFSLSTNLTLQDNINHSFEGILSGSSSRYHLRYIASNNSGFLLGVEFGRYSNLNGIRSIGCSGIVGESSICSSADCGAASSFVTDYHNFTFFF